MLTQIVTWTTIPQERRLRLGVNGKTVEDPQMVFLIPDMPKGVAPPVSKKPASRAQIYEVAAMAAFAALVFLFAVKVAPALVG